MDNFSTSVQLAIQKTKQTYKRQLGKKTSEWEDKGLIIVKKREIIA